MLVPAASQLRIRPVRAGGWALELLSPVPGRSIAPDTTIEPLPFPAAIPVLRAYGIPTGPPLPGLGIRTRLSALFDRHLASLEAFPGQWPPPPVPGQLDLAAQCDGTRCLPVRPDGTGPHS